MSHRQIKRHGKLNTRIVSLVEHQGIVLCRKLCHMRKRSIHRYFWFVGDTRRTLQPTGQLSQRREEFNFRFHQNMLSSTPMSGIRRIAGRKKWNLSMICTNRTKNLQKKPNNKRQRRQIVSDTFLVTLFSICRTYFRYEWLTERKRVRGREADESSNNLYEKYFTFMNYVVRCRAANASCALFLHSNFYDFRFFLLLPNVSPNEKKKIFITIYWYSPHWPLTIDMDFDHFDCALRTHDTIHSATQCDFSFRSVARHACDLIDNHQIIRSCQMKLWDCFAWEWVSPRSSISPFRNVDAWIPSSAPNECNYLHSPHSHTRITITIITWSLLLLLRLLLSAFIHSGFHAFLLHKFRYSGYCCSCCCSFLI